MANFSQRRFLKNPRKYSHTIYIYIDRKILDHQKIHRRFSNSRRIVIAGTFIYAIAESYERQSATCFRSHALLRNALRAFRRKKLHENVR